MVETTIGLPFYWLLNCIKRYLYTGALVAGKTHISELNRRSICRFQIEYINFAFTSARLHMRFKNSTDETKGERLAELYMGVDSGTKKLLGSIARHIQRYFIHTRNSPIEPRVGIHLVDEDLTVNAIVQFAENEMLLKSPKSINDYSVLKQISLDGKSYLENNIPKKVLSDPDYIHAGLDIENIRDNYISPIRDAKLLSRLSKNFSSNPEPDRKWAGMSHNGDQYGSLYKSHLVAPITFRKHAESGWLDQEMIRVLELPENGRCILGFIFIDHPSTYYFDDGNIDDGKNKYANIDVNEMTMWADLASFVLITNFMYTKGSSTIKAFIESQA